MRRGAIEYLHLETAGIRRDVVRALESAAEGATELQQIGEAAYGAATYDAHGDLPPDDLHERATHLQGLAHHAMTKALELATEAGKLEQLADVGRHAQAVGPPDE